MKELVTSQFLETVSDGGVAMVPGMEQQGDSPSLHCPTCGRPLDLRCEDCGCPVSCHDFIYPKDDERVPYCVWDFGPCPKERRQVFLAAVEFWLNEVATFTRPTTLPDQAPKVEEGQQRVELTRWSEKK